MTGYTVLAYTHSARVGLAPEWLHARQEDSARGTCSFKEVLLRGRGQR